LLGADYRTTDNLPVPYRCISIFNAPLMIFIALTCVLYAGFLSSILMPNLCYHELIAWREGYLFLNGSYQVIE